MTSAPRRWGGLPCAIALLALVLFAWSHRHALSLHGFADDLGLLVDLPQRASRGELWADVMAHITGPLWPGSVLWRPVPYASFALDAALWGSAPQRWHPTNLVLHLANASVVGWIAASVATVRRPNATPAAVTSRGSGAIVGSFAFAIFLPASWAPETTLWLVGRFDGWATFAMLMAVAFAIKSGVFIRSHDAPAVLDASVAPASPVAGRVRFTIASLVAALAAYASKESALLLPMLIGLMATLLFARPPPRARIALRALRPALALLAGHAALMGAYLLWRASLFASPAIHAYTGDATVGLMPMISRVFTHSAFVLGLAPLAPLAAGVSAFCGALLAICAWRNDATRFIVGMLLALCVIGAVAQYFPAPPGSGEGYRLYYLSGFGFALALSPAFDSRDARVGAWRLGIGVVLLISLALWQARVAAEWTRASREMREAIAALRTTANALPRADYALVLVPDQRGHVPFARNAQGALPALASQLGDGADVLSMLIVFTPPQLGEWHGLMQKDRIVQALTSRADAPAQPTRYYCYSPNKAALQDLGFWPPETLASWRVRWNKAVAAACPELPL